MAKRVGVSIVGLMPDADAAFAALARSTVDGLLERRPELATLLGEHAHDDRLTIGTAAHYDELARWCADRFAEAAAVNLGELSAEYRVDAQILFAQLEQVLFVTDGVARARVEPDAGQPRPGHLPAAGPGLRAAAEPAEQPGRAAGGGPGGAGGGAIHSGGPAAPGAPGDRDQPVRGDRAAGRAGTGPHARRGARRRGASRPRGRRAPRRWTRSPRIAAGWSSGWRTAPRATGSGIRGSGRSCSPASCSTPWSPARHRRNCWPGPRPTWTRRPGRSPRPRPGWGREASAGS